MFEIIDKLDTKNQIVAVGINCSSPLYISGLIKSAQEVNKGKREMIIYANNGGKWDAINKIFYQDPNVKPYEEYVSEWYNLGARIIGGCC